MGRKIKESLFKTTAILMATGFILISLELFLRVNEKFGHVTTSYTIKANNSWLENKFRRKRHSALLGYEHIPDFAGINSYGLVSQQYKLKKDRDTIRILILGDSIAEHFDNIFFEDLLNKLPSKNKFEIWNGAVGGYDIRHYYLYLKYRGLHYNPDIVFIFFCLNDFDIDTSVYYKDEKGAIQFNFNSSSELMRRYTPNSFLMRYSYLYRFLILKANNYLLGIEAKRRGINPEEEEARYYLAGIKNICDKNNLPIFAIVFPYLKPLNEYNQWQQEQYESIMRALRDFDITCFDLHNYLPQKELYSLRRKKNKDDTHPNPEGYRLIAKIIYDYFSKIEFFYQRRLSQPQISKKWILS